MSNPQATSAPPPARRGNAARLSRWSCAASCLAATLSALAPAADVTVEIDRVNPAPTPVSNYQTGVTFTQTTLLHYYNESAKATARQYLSEACTLYNVHIKGWGAASPMPNIPPNGVIANGTWDWTSLDRRMREIRAIPGSNKKIVITFCGCPDWMQKPLDGNYWNDLDGVTHPDNVKKRPDNSNFNRFADLCATIAKRYDGNTTDPLDSSKKLPKAEYFQVWNEMNGFWDFANNKQDMTTYLLMYDAIWAKVKASTCRPDAKLGGPYPTIECTGSDRNWSANPDVVTNTGHPDGPNFNIGPYLGYWPDDQPLKVNGFHKQREMLAQFMAATKASDRIPDFFCFDRGVIYYNQLRDQHRYKADEVMEYTGKFAEIVDTVNQMMEQSQHYGTRLPIWFSEYYGSRYEGLHQWWRPDDMDNSGKPKAGTLPFYEETNTAAFQNALYASMYNHMIRSGVAAALLWGPEEGNPNIAHHLWTSTQNSGGGQPFQPHAQLFKDIHQHFSAGMPLHKTTSTLDGVEVLAGGQKVMLINKTSSNKTVQIDDGQNQVDYFKTHSSPITLTAHQVKVFDALPFVKNGSMSADASGVPADWNRSWVDQSKPGTVQVARVSNQFANPDKCEAPGEGTHWSLNIKSGDGQLIKAMRGQRITCYPDPVSGSTYQVTGMLRYSGTGSTTKRVIMKMFDKDMDEIAGTWTSLYIGVNNNQWEMFNPTVNVPANARHLEIWLDYEGTGQVWLDAVRIVAPSKP